MAHGDLQHGNILVQAGGQLKVVDYDGMFVPGMSRLGMEAAESGLPAYQHPSRARPDYFDARLDDFAALVLLLTLASMTLDRWRALSWRRQLSARQQASDSQSPAIGAVPRAGGFARGPIRRLANL